MDADKESARKARLAARRKKEKEEVRAQRIEARELRAEILRLIQAARRGKKDAWKMLKERCAASLAYRRVYSTILVERKGTVTRIGPESFTPGTSKKVQGGRVNPR
jgi:hypothetical protein